MTVLTKARASEETRHLLSPSEPRHFPATDSPEALARKVAFLRRRNSYPIRPPRVETIQTHMSWVFLAGERAYKLKKPIANEVLDFSSLEARRLCCGREVRLNRHLAPGIYLDTVPLTVSANGRLHLRRADDIVEWLVEMRRLPRDQSLAHRIRTGRVVIDELEGLGDTLVDFYQHSPPVALSLETYSQRLEGEVRACTDVLSGSQGQLPRELVMALACTQMRFIGKHSPMLEERLDLIVEGHGDLRPEHVYFTAPRPVVIDSLEFDRNLRILDPADELSYLELECARLGAESIGQAIFDRYRMGTGDSPPTPLRHFYKCHRAFVRAKIAFWHLRDCSGTKADRWLARARSYLGLAAREMVAVRNL